MESHEELDPAIVDLRAAFVADRERTYRRWMQYAEEAPPERRAWYAERAERFGGGPLPWEEGWNPNAGIDELIHGVR